VSAPPDTVFCFGDFELDPHERRLLAHGVAVTLTPKVFDTLVMLVERAGHVVGKEELMAALWPRGFVEESNLTKHIWLIRKALGDSGHPARFVETVPKLGYRFIAPVKRTEQDDKTRREDVAVEALSTSTTDAPAALTAATTPPAGPLPAKLRRWPAIVAALAVMTAVAGVAIWRHGAQTPTVAATTPGAGNTVAIVDFNNLSQNAKDAWLGPALAEMLGVETMTGGRLHVLPDELVRPARIDLAAPLAGGYATQSLATLRRRLGADYVLSGSYLVSGEGDSPALRIDLSVQDARDGRTLASISHSGRVADLPTLVAQAGADLRTHLGVQPVPATELQAVAQAEPPTAEVARRLGFALDALHKSDPARARDELLEAVALAPGYAPAYSYLAQAWSALGYDAKATAAAMQASQRAQGLPAEQRAQIELQLQTAQRAWPKAETAARKLITLRPDNPEYRLRLVRVLLDANDDNAAANALDELRKLPGSSDDPRVELAAADIAGARADPKGAVAPARKALALAQARGVPGQIADAQYRLGTALMFQGEVAEARSVLRQAIAAYQHGGNPAGEAAARESLGKSLQDHDVAQAREEYQRAMSIYQGIGDLGGVTAAYTDLTRVLWNAGDRDGAETAARHVADLGRQTGDLRMQAWGLQALATVASDDAAGDDVVQEYRQVIALNEKTSDPGVWTLANYADVMRMRGQLDEAEGTCNRAIGKLKQLTDPQFAIFAQFTCAQVEMDRGNIVAARHGFEVVASLAHDTGSTIYEANAEMSLAQIDMGRGHCHEARPRFERAVQNFATAKAPTGEADVQAMLALCADTLGDAPARDRALARARDLRRGVTERQEIYVVDIAAAILRGRDGDTAGAVTALRALADDAAQRHWQNWALECRLAIVQLLKLNHDPRAATEHARLVADAKRLGFGWITQRLAAG
jgi:DNA-binding winged helix-turn-helix (wHTH) protein/tetratricopeptide (TPR) repeat protein